MNRSQMLRFGLVGVTQNGINVLTFAIVIQLGLDYRFAAALAALVALVVSFSLNRRWTFGLGGHTPWVGHAVRYTLVFLAAVTLGVVLLTFFVEQISLEPLAGQVLAISIVAPLSFLVQRTWVFSESAPDHPRSKPASLRLP